MKKYNFTAGPSILANEIVEEIKIEISNDNELSILEISHRGKLIGDLFEESRQLLKDLMHLNDDYEVLFLHGGASLQNTMIPYNIKTNGSASYTDTGLWATKSIEESKAIRATTVVSSSKDRLYSYIPKNIEWDEDGYLHITTNNTVSGTQYHDYSFCEGKRNIIADMSSDILSRHFDYSKFDLIYGGLQKNLGTAGGSFVVINKNLVEDLLNVPSMLNYKSHLDAISILNTPPVFAVFVSNLVLKWIKNKGMDYINDNNTKKSKLLYDTLDNSSLYFGLVDREDRSMMNVTFELTNLNLKSSFNTFMNEKGIEGIEGHRSRGGYRASLYNMMPYSHVEYFVECLKEFERTC